MLLVCSFLFQWFYCQYQLLSRTLISTLTKLIPFDSYTVVQAKAAVTGISHRLPANDPAVVDQALDAMGSLMKTWKETLKEDQYRHVSEHLFSSEGVKSILGSVWDTETRRQGIYILVPDLLHSS